MDIKMHYYEKGSGTPLLMIHGNSETGEYFVNQVDCFAKKYRVICPDSRAHGKTPRGTKPLRIRQMAEDYIAFMDELGIEKADILGFSDGGNIAIFMAARHPERVGKLILNGANLNNDGADPEIVAYVTAEYAKALEEAKRDPAAVVKAEILDLMVDDPNIDPSELRKIKSPTLVIAGTKDLILKEHTELIASLIDGAELAFVKGDHFCAAGNPEEFNSVVAHFLAK